MTKHLFFVILFFFFVFVNSSAQPLTATITPAKAAADNVVFNMGTDVNPKGQTRTVNTQSVLINQKPVLPVMGEIHFSRVPESEWENELLKMKAGGITIIATYVFWIHHEEVEGRYNFTGQRNLRKFINICTQLNLPLVLRIGPWAHGECRNGGLPDWLVGSGIKLRNTNDAYMAKVRGWYQQIYNQAAGLLWKNGGSVIGIQLENEYGGKWEHLMDLKNMARQIGFDVPLYTRTGWPKLSSPAVFGEIVPLYGDYADGFWDRKLTEMPGDYSKAFLFRSFRNSTVIATEQLPLQSNKDNPLDIGYPYLTCELGGGMMPSYHRRINMLPMDVYAMALIKVGSGSNLPGYYMYHGGTNPTGTLTTLNEEQATPYTYHNDLPVKTYDFQAPLGEFGQINPHYHLLRRLHLFLQDFGGELATMKPFFVDSITNPDNNSTLRWNVRSNGSSGYVFINNYQRLAPMPVKENISFSIALPTEKLSFPKTAVTVPANSSFFLPFNMQVGNAILKYAMAQPICKIKNGKTLTYFFAQLPQIKSSFLFNAENVKVLDAAAPIEKNGTWVYIDDAKPGSKPLVSFKDENNDITEIILLDEATSLQFWKGELAGKSYGVISAAGITFNGNWLQLSHTQAKMQLAIYPSLQSLKKSGKTLKGAQDGIFTRYQIALPQPQPVTALLNNTTVAGLPRTIILGKANVAESPKDSAFASAAVWQIQLPPLTNKGRDLYLSIPYTGDVARLYCNEQLLTDNFYNGKPFEIGLKYFARFNVYAKGLTLKILPLQKEAPVYLQQLAKPNFKEAASFLNLPGIEVYEKFHVKLSVK